MSQPTLTKVQREQVDAAAAVFKPWGLVWTIAKDGPHPHMAVQGPKGGIWRLTFLCTPRDDGRAVQKAEARARRLVNEIMKRAGVLP